MFAKVWISIAFLLFIACEVQAHAAISPVLGLQGEPKRSDAKRPSTANPCGRRVNVAATIDTSTPVQAAADGTFTATITNFNRGRDGSRQVSAKVDAAGTGKNFVAATVTQNGVAAPRDKTSESIVATLPAGTTCTGGKAGNLCLVSFETLGGFGNCIVVQQAASDATQANTGNAATGNEARKVADDRVPSGSRLARALRYTQVEGEHVRRSIGGWIWA